MSAFQSQVNGVQAPGIAGEFCSTNPRYSVLAGPGGLIAGVAGVIIARFAWLSDVIVDGDNAPAVVNNFGSGQPAGFIHREQQALITNYLGESSNVVPAGFPITVMDSGEFWVKNDGTGVATPGMKCYANYADGKATFAAAGAAATASATGSIAANTGSFTGSIAGQVMTITVVGSGVVVPGGTLSGTGVVSGTKVIGQILPLIGAETLGGVGRYTVSISEQTVASTTISETYGTFTAASALVGTFGVGDTLSGTNVVAGTTITALGTGTGGLGTYIVDNNTVVSSTTITAALQAETKWICRSNGLAGEIVKISTVT